MLADEAAVLPWEYGRMFALRLSARFVRVSSRGVQFSTVAALRNVSGLAWMGGGVPCLPVPDALCSEGDALAYFPAKDVDIPYDFATLRPSSFTRHFPNGTCTRQDSRRAIRVDDRRYEVSLCDLVDANLDIVLDAVHDVVFWRQDSTSTWEFVFVSAMSVYITSCVSANVVNISKGVQWRTTRVDFAVLVANMVYLLLSWIPRCSVGGVNACGGLSFLLTDADLALAAALSAYVVFESAALLVERLAPTGRRPVGGVSVYTALLLLLTLRMHNTFDNPYLPILAVMFGTRTLHKVALLDHVEPLACLVVAYDVVCLGMLLALGVGHASHDEVDAVNTQLALFVVMLLLATAVELKTPVETPVETPVKAGEAGDGR